MRSTLQYILPAVLAMMVSGMSAILVAFSDSASAQQIEILNEAEYRQCMAIIRTNPDKAFEQALTWEDLGGGAPARHCAAAALMAGGHFPEAATRMEELAKSMPDDSPPELVAEILAHAGIGWMQAGNLDRAYGAQTEALKIHPDATDILTDRALVLAEQDLYWQALDDLNRAISLDSGNVDAYVFRATAYRYVDAMDLALEDAEQALRLDPTHPEGLLERGIVRRLTGDLAGARADWLELIELHDGRPAAELARRNLELLDLNEDRVVD